MEGYPLKFPRTGTNKQTIELDIHIFCFYHPKEAKQHKKTKTRSKEPFEDGSTQGANVN